MSLSPHEYSARARAAEAQGRRDEALRIMAEGVATHPSSADLFNSFGSLALRAGLARDAARYFAKAAALAPGNFEFALNQVIALGACGANNRALELARSVEAQGSSVSRYWSARGNVARGAGDLAEAAISYDRCLQLDPTHKRGLHGRARCALERGEAGAVTRFDQALATNPNEADLWLGKVQALDAAGETKAARELASRLVDQVPHWTEVLRILAQLEIQLGRKDYDHYFHTAAEKSPATPVIPHAHIQLLASQDNFVQAAQAAGRAAANFPSESWFRLAEASNTGMAGDLDHATRLFEKLELDTPERALLDGRHHLRCGRLENAERLLASAANSPELSHSAYALLGFLWRLTGDNRAEWLHEQAGLVQFLPLAGPGDLLPQVISALDVLHDRSSFPVGQSLRGGTQTRHILFRRHEAVFARLRQAIELTLENYRSALPSEDAGHPLLCHRNAPWQLEGSWSVRLAGGGDHHAPHIHPRGMLSSALYLVVPEEAAGEEASALLEIGRPPPDLLLDLPPLTSIRPETGKLALFPSTLYHGTTAFSGKQRMTVAFDVIPVARQVDE